MGDDDLRGRFRRDFTREPIRSAHSPQNKPQESTTVDKQVPSGPQPAPLPQTPILEDSHSNNYRPKKRRRTKKKFLIFVILLVVAGAGYLAYKHYYLKPVVPQSIVSQSEIPILYPAKLPNGFSIDQTSFNITQGNIITYFAANQTGEHIVVSLQKRPANFDYATFYSKGLTNSTTFNTSLGQAAIGTTDGHLLGSLTTDKTWAIVSSPSKDISTSDVKLVLDSMKQIAPRSN